MRHGNPSPPQPANTSSAASRKAKRSRRLVTIPMLLSETPDIHARSETSTVMSDSDEAGIPQRRSVAEHVDNCLDCLRRCLVQASAIHPRESALIEDQLASFSTWSSGAGVFSPGRASLDHRLRYTPDVHRVVVDLLHSLAYRIQSCEHNIE